MRSARCFYFLLRPHRFLRHIYSVVLLYAIVYMPTLALTNSLAFRQMRDPKVEFAPIRVLGTFGWIVAGLTISALKIETTAVPMRMAAGASLLLAIYSLTCRTRRRLAQARNLASATSFPPRC